MEFHLEAGQLSKLETDLLIIAVFQDKPIKEQIAQADSTFPRNFLKALDEHWQSEKFQAKLNQRSILPTYGNIKAKKICIAGLGPSNEYKHSHLRKMAANIARLTLSQEHTQSICFCLPLDISEPQDIQALVEGFHLGSYAFTKYKTNKEDKKSAAKKEVSIACATTAKSDFKSAVNTGKIVGEATNWARQVIAEPASYLTPTRLANEAASLAEKNGFDATIYDRKAIDEFGMGAFLGVAKGAKEQPKLIVLEYSHAKAKKTIALVGKGITFDSGGLSLKPPQGMENMKYDMSGGAAVIAAITACARLKLPIAVVAVVCATENMPGDQALHPGDVLEAMNGKTIEVNNTDAEGRLILADALSYVCSQTKADVIIDMATLTGAVVTALGRAAAGIMGNNAELIADLSASADKAGEKLWQLPLYDEYKESLKSNIADLKNAGAKGEAPSSCAAMFLKEFVDKRPWAHIDIAGPGWMDKEKDEVNKGGTAFGVRTLCHFLISQTGA